MYFFDLKSLLPLLCTESPFRASVDSTHQGAAPNPYLAGGKLASDLDSTLVRMGIRKATLTNVSTPACQWGLGAQGSPLLRTGSPSRASVDSTHKGVAPNPYLAGIEYAHLPQHTIAFTIPPIYYSFFSIDFFILRDLKFHWTHTLL